MKMCRVKGGKIWKFWDVMEILFGKIWILLAEKIFLKTEK